MIFTLWTLRENSRVVAYTVHEPPNPPATSVERAEKLIFVKDGFNWFAALLAPIWMLTNRLWLALLLYILVAGGMAVGLTAAGVAPYWVMMADIALNIMIGLEADSIMRWSLARGGAKMVGTVVGRNSAECERRFFETWLPNQPRLDGFHSRSAVSFDHAPAGAATYGAMPSSASSSGASSGSLPGAFSAGAPIASAKLERGPWRLFRRPSGSSSGNNA